MPAKTALLTIAIVEIYNHVKDNAYYYYKKKDSENGVGFPNHVHRNTGIFGIVKHTGI